MTQTASLKPDFAIETLLSPFKKHLARQFKQKFDNLLSTYAEKKDVAIVDETSSLKLLQDLGDTAILLRDAQTAELKTRQDALDKVAGLNNVVKRFSDIAAALVQYGPNALNGSDQILTARRDFVVASMELVGKPAFLKSDRQKIENMQQAAQNYLRQECPRLDVAIRIGTIRYAGPLAAMSIKDTYNVMGMQSDRPLFFGRAYQDQPII